MFESRISIMYVLHLSSKYTGANKSLLNLLEGLKFSFVEPIVVLPLLEDMSMIPELERLNIKYYVFKYFMPIFPPTDTLKGKLYLIPKFIRSKIYNRLTESKLKRLVSKHNISMIHTNVGPLLIGFNVAAELKLPHVWHLREFQDLDFSMNTWYTKASFQKKLAASNNHTIAISDAVFKHFDLSLPSRVIYNGIMKANESQLISIKEKYFLFVGFILASKGVDVLLRCFNAFLEKHPGYKLLIAGVAPDPFYLDGLNGFIRDKGIQENVEFLGHRDDVSALMSKATALIVPSLNEAFGRITAEAMFNGCNVIGKDSGGTKEIVEIVGVGTLYRDDEMLITALEQAVARTDDAESLVELEFAMRKAVSLFSVESNVESIFNFYNNVLDN